MRDLYHDLKPEVSLHFAAHTSTDTGDAVDLQGYEGALIIVPTGTITDGTHTISLLESDDNSSYSAVSSDDILGEAPEIDSNDDDTVFSFGYIGTKRYLKVKVTVANANSGGIYGALVIKGFPRHAPANS